MCKNDVIIEKEIRILKFVADIIVCKCAFN